MNTTNLVITYGASTGIYWIIGLIFTLILTFLAIYSKKPVIYLAAMICWIGCYLETPMQNTFYNVGMGIMVLFCILAGFFNWRNNRVRG